MVCKSRSRVAGLSGGTISRAGGGTASFTGGQGTGLCAQPPSKLAPATISCVQSSFKVTLYPLSALNLAPVCLM